MFYYESRFKIKNKNNIFFLAGEGGGGGKARVSDFFTKNPNLKRKFFFFWGGGGGRGLGGVRRGRGTWMDRQTGPNQFAPSTSSKLGA